MAIRITHIQPKPVSTTDSASAVAHISIENFRWIDEQDMQTGTSNRNTMFDWIVNKKGKAYVKIGNDNIPVFGAIAPNGQYYIRSLENGTWTDRILSLPSF